MKEISVLLGKLSLSPSTELFNVRIRINDLVRKNHDLALQEGGNEGDVKRYRFERAHNLSQDWCFVDCKF